MALYAFDGTGCLDQPLDAYDTNVVRFFASYRDPAKNSDPAQRRGSLYQIGIGTLARTMLGTAVSQAFGIGGHKRVRAALKRLESNLAGGDEVIDVAGFSRGAALAVSFANKIANRHPGLKIRFMALWEAVGQFGAPGMRLQAFHNLKLPGNVTRCCHAMALDEQRWMFPLTRMIQEPGNHGRVTEVWFRGVHSDVGGGNGNAGLNWISLQWMFQSAVSAGLPIEQTAIESNRTRSGLVQKVSPHRVIARRPRKVLKSDLAHTSVSRDVWRDLKRIDDAGWVLEPA